MTRALCYTSYTLTKMKWHNEETQVFSLSEKKEDMLLENLSLKKINFKSI